VRVFNLEVANAHTFFVGEEGALAHNARSSTSGNNPASQRGRQFDRAPYPPGYQPQVDIGNGMRVDGLNETTGHIFERKCTGRWQTVRNGQRRAKDYVDQLNKTRPRPNGQSWTADIDVLNPATGNRSTIPAVR
jgi:hypothetical protein